MMIRSYTSPAWLLAAGVVLAGIAGPAAADASKGANVFAEECGDCHSVTPGKNKKGPSLSGVVGRNAGSIADFSGYSDAMKQAGFAWTTERLDAYIAQPRKAVPAGRMKYDGLANAQARADLVLYLATLK
jgi:cytochrome c